MDYMDIANVSMALANRQVNSNYGVAMLSKSIDNFENMGDQITKMMDAASLERSVNPSVGSNFDMFV